MKQLTTGQKAMLIAATVPMVAAGAFGAWGTYTNVVEEFGRAATAAGVVAAGEGVALILALVMVGLTLLGQSAPLPVRAGLWAAPVAAAITGIAVADTTTEAIVYAVTPMAMTASAEGLGLLARRVVIYVTGVDAEAQRRNAATVQRLAVAQARAANHPDRAARAWATRRSWRLFGRVGVGDQALGADLVDVQRDRLRQGADAALVGMLSLGTTDAPAAAAATPSTPAPAPYRSATDVLRESLGEMDPTDAIRVAHDARPDMPPAELASLLVSYGIVVDAVQVALVLHKPAPEHTVERADAATHPQVSELPPVNLQEAVWEAASTLGPEAKAKQIAAHLREQRRLVVDEPYIRAALSRQKKAAVGETKLRPMEGGYA
ncbi:hypothetical protein [Streptomyces sp. MJP52]|uniref:hypothetical protein n=1 Tax=Streptomyces sp. MJP52 TaxID=2940555 RepID=UPI0024746AB4|nr:hypothetical protein [Streptomyces sp. MJP52]MDH6226230.1 hypothetical protein [Streptomyces sp. MJP52]